MQQLPSSAPTQQTAVPTPRHSRKRLLVMFLGIILVCAIIGGGIFLYRGEFNSDILKGSLLSETNVPKAPIISADQLRDMLAKKDNFILLDVRPNEEFLTEHVDGAINIPFDELTSRYQELFPFDRAIVTMCSGDSCHLSTRAGTLLIQFGFTNVKNYEEGVAGWKLKNFPLLLQNGTKTGTLNGLVAGELTIQALKQKIDAHEQMQLFDIRSASDFARGHIAGATILSTENIDQATSSIEKGALVIIYDADGSVSREAAYELSNQGYQNVRYVSGGFGLWSLSSYPVVK